MHEPENEANATNRVRHRVVKVARTIADIAAVENIEAQHLAEALRFRPISS